MEPCMVNVANWVPYKTVWGCSFSNDAAEPSPALFPINLVAVAHKTKTDVKEQAGFNFSSDGVWLVFSIEVSYSTVKAELPSLLSESQKEWVYRHKSHRNSYLHRRILSWSTSETVGNAVDLWRLLPHGKVQWKRRGWSVQTCIPHSSSLCRILDKISPEDCVMKACFSKRDLFHYLLSDKWKNIWTLGCVSINLLCL